MVNIERRFTIPDGSFKILKALVNPSEGFKFDLSKDTYKRGNEKSDETKNTQRIVTYMYNTIKDRRKNEGVCKIEYDIYSSIEEKDTFENLGWTNKDYLLIFKPCHYNKLQNYLEQEGYKIKNLIRRKILHIKYFKKGSGKSDRLNKKGTKKLILYGLDNSIDTEIFLLKQFDERNELPFLYESEYFKQSLAYGLIEVIDKRDIGDINNLLNLIPANLFIYYLQGKIFGSDELTNSMEVEEILISFLLQEYLKTDDSNKKKVLKQIIKRM